MTDYDRATFETWVAFLDAIREGRLRFEPGAYARVEYESNYADERQVLEGEVDRVSNSLGRPFSLEGTDKVVEGWHVEGADGRQIGHVWEITFERDPME